MVGLGKRPQIAVKPDEPLHVRLRPRTLTDVIGQTPVVDSLGRLLKSGHVPHAFLFTGPSGVGKTTLGRILASAIGVGETNLMEIDAATYSGVDTMREITAMTQYASLGTNPKKFLIVDECHALTKATWQSLLKSLEEPPAHVYWTLCTTEADKVPQTIRTRCHAYELKPVRKDVIFDYLTKVAAAEGLVVVEEAIQYIADQCGGSVRLALQQLSMVDGVQTRAAAHEILAQSVENEQVIDFVRKLVAGKGLTWKGAMESVKRLEDESPEGIRLTLVNYIGVVLRNTTDEQQAVRLLTLLNHFREPFRPNEKWAPFLLALGHVFYQE